MTQSLKVLYNLLQITWQYRADSLSLCNNDQLFWANNLAMPRQHLSARDFDRQIVATQIRVATLNGFTVLGIPQTEAAG